MECPRKPDLVVEKKVTFNEEGEFVVNYTVTNIGDAPAGAVNSSICKLVNGELMECQPCPTLEPDESYSGSFEPEICPCGTTLNVTVCVDYYDLVEESNETNNCESNIVQCPIPSIEVNKTVYDRATGEWRDLSLIHI